MDRIMSLNPDFTALLMRMPDGHTIGERYAVYESATDGLPPHEWLKARRIQEEGLEPSALLTPGDENQRPEKWPSPFAQAITGSIPRITSM